MQTFSGKLKVKLGAIRVAYKGTVHILETEELDDGVAVTIRPRAVRSAAKARPGPTSN